MANVLVDDGLDRLVELARGLELHVRHNLEHARLRKSRMFPSKKERPDHDVRQVGLIDPATGLDFEARKRHGRRGRKHESVELERIQA